ncbi:MAG: hypothetical protein LC772_08370, partial [Chloroflexi bacterium]|nr:hypothetical protein [Chloroflexota bacterium]
MKHFPYFRCTPRVLRTALFMACALTAARPSIAIFPGAMAAVNGIATTKDGRPLPHATLFLLGVPPGESWSATLGDATTVVTDDQGRFTWTVPEHVDIFSNNGSSPPPCWALAADRRVTSFAVRTSASSDNDNSRRDLLERASRQCVTHWIDPETNPVLAVTVPDVANVSLTIRGTDGMPLRRRSVQVFSPETFSNFEGAVVYDGSTDEAGRLTTRWYTGVRRIDLIVPGVGFGSTGTVEGLPGRATTAHLPPLAPFSRISGTVASTLRAPAAVVALDDRSFSDHRWYHPTAVVAADGTFSLQEVLPGEHGVSLRGVIGAAEPDITVLAGESVTGVVLAPAPPAPTAPPATSPSGTKVPPVAQPGPQSLRGTVTDTEGHPVDGATIYAICTLQNVPFSTPTQILLTASTNTAGEYLIPKLPGGPSGVSILLIASHAGFARAQASALSGRNGPPGDLQVDLVLPSLKTSLAVRVVRNGHPVPGALVRITQAAGYYNFEADLRLQPANKDAYDAVAQLMAPTATTDANGQALFQGVSPGVWNLIASDAASAAHVPRFGQWADEREIWRAIDRGEAHGVIVRAGQTSDFTLKLYAHPDEVSFQVFGPDGKLPADAEIGVSSTQLRPPDYQSSVVTLDAAGVGTHQLPSPGLWRAAAFYLHGPL